MITPIKGLGGVQGFVREDAFATAEQRSGGTADPKHAERGETAKPYPWENFPGEPHGPFGVENELLGMEPDQFIDGHGYLAQDPTADLQPITHAANWPKGLPTTVHPDEVSARREESRLIHAQGMGGSREALYLPTLDATQDEWVELWEVDPGVTIPPQPAQPEMLKGTGIMGYGSTDRNATFARQNGYGFDSAHMHRRYATGSIPGNYMWMEPGSRPLVKSIPRGGSIPTGPNSPFAGQDGNLGYDAQGSVLQDLPVEYAGPPAPALASQYAGDDSSIVEYW